MQGGIGWQRRPVREDETSIAATHDVELDHVDTVRGGDLDRGEAVLGPERRCTAMADPDDVAVAAEQVHQGRRRMTTTARSSESSPPE